MILDVNENNSIDVKEYITVDFYEAGHHGIYRFIPQWLKYTGKDNKTISRKAKISNLTSYSDQYSVGFEKGKLQIKMGSANRTLPIGTHTYAIKYTYDMGTDPYENFDEFIFHTFGDFWGTRINNAYVEIGKKTNDYIRGNGVFKKVARAIKYLKKYNIYVSLSFTANKLNYKEFPKVVNFAEKYGVNNLWSDRFIPLNLNTDMNLQMNKAETNEYLKIMKEEKTKLKLRKSKTNIAMYRALQFQMTNNYPYACTAGKSLLTVMENGDLVPCRRMPIVVGNLQKENMYELYKNSSILKKLRNDNIPDDCKKCEHSKLCAGGLKCLTYALYKDFNHKDIGCNIN